jgi:hypothetical protein
MHAVTLRRAEDGLNQFRPPGKLTRGNLLVRGRRVEVDPLQFCGPGKLTCGTDWAAGDASK